MVESINYSEAKREKLPTVYVLQEIAGTREGRPKINIMGAANMVELNFYYLSYLKLFFLRVH